MKIKIVSNGTQEGTSVLNAETGEELEHVIAIAWEIVGKRDGSGMAECKITLEDVPVDLEGSDG